MRGSAFYQFSISSNSTYLLMVVFRTLQRVVVGCGASVKLVCSRSRYVHYSRGLYPIVGRVFLAFVSYLYPRSYIVSSSERSNVLRFRVRFVCVFSYHAVGGSAIFSILYGVFLGHFLLPAYQSCFGVGVFSIGAKCVCVEEFGVGCFGGVFSCFLYYYYYGYASSQPS